MNNNFNFHNIYLDVVYISKIEELGTIEDQMASGVGDPIIGQIFENCIGALEQCPFQGLDTINYLEVKEAFAQLIKMLDAVGPLEKNTRLNNAIKCQVENLKNINFDRIWTKYAGTDELPQITWTQIDQNNPLAVETFFQNYKTRIQQVFRGFKESIYKSCLLSYTIIELKQFLGSQGLWNEVKDYYVQAERNEVPALPFAHINDAFPNIKSLLLQMSGIQVQWNWINGTRAQLLELINGKIIGLRLDIRTNIKNCLRALWNHVPLGGQPLGTITFEEQQPSFLQTLIMDYWTDEKTKQLIQTSKAKLEEISELFREFNYLIIQVQNLELGEDLVVF